MESIKSGWLASVEETLFQKTPSEKMSAQNQTNRKPPADRETDSRRDASTEPKAILDSERFPSPDPDGAFEMALESSSLSTPSDKRNEESSVRTQSGEALIDRPHPQMVVGIGASAGGLEALDRVFRNMPVDTGMSFVVIQHLSPDFKSHMDELLGRITTIPVKVVDDGMDVEPNTIYLIPPKKEMVISNGKLLLTERSREKTLSLPIDQFFRALAQDAGDRAVGMILSGTGSDGSRGIAAIAEEGGLVIAQDPNSCSFDAMPVNAQQTGKVHLVLAPELIGDMLQRYKTSGLSPMQMLDDANDRQTLTGIDRVFQLLQRMHGINFSFYKTGTISRRVQRRVDLLQLADVDHYVRYIEEDPDEVDKLYNDLLIGVTRFFRDTEAFEIFEKEVLPDLIRRCDGVFRAWVCACATGEEAYSIAMLISEAVEKSGRDIDFKVFATDAHRGSLKFAAAGLYSESSMEHVSDERRKNFFVQRDGGLMVNSELRRSIVFAPQNVIVDPPFTQMHLVTCRNMLIYLQPPAQKKTMSLFHFALKNGGILFLGPSESAGQISDEFETVNSHWKIFQKRRNVRLPIEMRIPVQGTVPAISSAGEKTFSRAISSLPRTDDVLPEAYDTLLGELMPPSVLIDSELRVFHVFAGGDVYLRVPTGRISSNILDMVYTGIKNSLANAIQIAVKDDRTVRYSGLPHPDPENDSQVRLVVRPLRLRSANEDCFLIQFETAEAEEIPADDETDANDEDDSHFNFAEVSKSRIESLEQELSYSRQNLQATIEELETSNEELQATNEEMVAANEELQSTNEELHSVNEELYTVNAEHQARVSELDQANTDMNHLLETTQVGVLFLDTDFRVRRFTPAIGDLLQLKSQDIGRHLRTFTNEIDDDSFMDRLQEVLDQAAPQEWEISIGDEPFLVRVLPYRQHHSIEGVIVSMVNVAGLRKAQEDVARFKFMADENIEAQVLIDQDAKVIYANKMMCKQLGYTREEIANVSVVEFDIVFNADNYRRAFDDAFENDGVVLQSKHQDKSGRPFPVEIAMTPVSFSGKRYLFATIRDTTERDARESRMKMLSQAVSSAVNGIVIADATDHDFPIIFANEGFQKMTGYDENEILGRNCRFLQGKNTDRKDVAKIRRSIEQCETSRTMIRNYRKDGSTFWNDLYITPVIDDDGKMTHLVGIQNDVTERVEAGELARQNERTIRLLLDSTAEGIFGLDVDGDITFCNDSAAVMFGHQNGDEMTGLAIHHLIQPQRADGSEYPIGESTIMNSLRRGTSDNRRNEVFLRRDGSNFPVEFWCHPIRQDDAVIGVVVTFVDISEQLAIECKLTETRDEANAANEAKSRFLANMSHELRTPLSAMIGFTKIAQEEHADVEGLSEKLDTIHRNGNYLLRLVGDVLDLSRIEAGKLSTSRSIERLDELLGDVHATMRMRSKEYETKLRFDLINPLPITVTMDAARLRQVMINLIANALKFSPGGNVNVSVRTHQRQLNDNSPAENWLVVGVEDNGIGIADDALDSLFDPFVQADQTISERFGGTGLGLSITKRLVSAMGGSIRVESELGRGSVFTFEIPIDPVGKISELSLDSQSRSGTAKLLADHLTPDLASDHDPTKLSAKVLIADDMRDIRFIAKHFLSKADCQIEVAENGRRAIDMVFEAENAGEPFDLILMDIQMPRLDGVGAVAELRERGCEIPIIALTADAMKGTRRRLIAMGFDEYLSKPLEVNKLLRIARGLLDRT